MTIRNKIKKILWKYHGTSDGLDDICSLFLKEYEKGKPKPLTVYRNDKDDFVDYSAKEYNQALELVDEAIYKMLKTK